MTKCGNENIKAKLFNRDLMSNWVFGSFSVALGKLWGDPGGVEGTSGWGWSFLLCFFHSESTVSERSLNFLLVCWKRLSSSTLFVRFCRLHCDMTESNWELEKLVRNEFFAFCGSLLKPAAIFQAVKLGNQGQKTAFSSFRLERGISHFLNYHVPTELSLLPNLFEFPRSFAS